MQIDVIAARQCARLLRKPGLLADLAVLELTPLKPAPQREQASSQLTTDLDKLLAGHQKVFSPPLLPELRKEDNHKIKLTPGAEAPSRPPFRLSQAEDQELQKQLAKLLEDGLIHESVSPFGAPILFVRKKDGALRMCVDYRLVNKLTIRDAYPLPKVQDLLDQLQGANVFSKVDLKTGYYQLRMDPLDEVKTAFATRYGTYQWRVLPLGLCNAPATFQRLMDKAFRTALGKFAFVYLDDVIIFSRSESEHLQHVAQILQLLEANKLSLSREKCEFGRRSLLFLGHVVSPGHISMEEDKVSAIRDWARPTTKKELQAFLGLTNYYRRFVRDYAFTATPLTDLTGGGKEPTGSGGAPSKIVWTAAAHHAFRKLKEAISTAPVLRMPDPNLPFTVLCDASDLAVGAILQQDDGRGPRPVAFVSKRLSTAEANYMVRDKELLAVTYALRQFRVYLLGNPFVVNTDHESLRYLLTQKDLTGRLARWAEALADFNMTIEHIQGRDNPADVLSRPPAREPGPNAETGKEEAGVEGTTETAVDALTTSSAAVSLGHEQHRYKDDKYFGPVLGVLRGEEVTSGTLRVRAARFTLAEDGRLYLREGHRLCLAEGDAKMRLEALQAAHDEATGGHQGPDRTYGRLAKVAFWPRMAQTVDRFVKQCDKCQRMKADTRPPKAPHQPLQVPSAPWEAVSMDFMGLPQTLRGHDSLFVVVDLFSMQLHLMPTTTTVDATGVAHLFLEGVFRHHGLPRSIVSDRDPRFVSEVWSQLWSALGTKLRMTVAHRPQADGATERANRSILEALRSAVNDCGTDWDSPTILPAIEFALNSSRKPATKLSAFQSATGLTPRGPLELSSSPGLGLPTTTQNMETRAPTTPSSIADALRSRITRTKDALHQKKEQQSDKMDSTKLPHEVPFLVGSQVLLSTKNYPQFKLNKLSPRYLGPFRVSRVRGANLTLELPSRFKIHPTVNVDNVRPFRPVTTTEWPGRAKPAPPPMQDAQGKPLFLMERFLARRICRGQPQLLVRWEGFGPEADSWEPQRAVEPQCGDLMERFLQMQPAATRKSKRNRGGG